MRQALIVAVIVALAGGVIVAQQQVSPRSPAARKALERRDYAVRKAEQEYRRALAEAHRTLIADLETAKAAAMKANQLDEANAIQAAIDAAQADLDAAMGKAQTRTFEIDAARNWQPTVEVRAGQRVEIVSRGRWTAAKSNPAFMSGPEGIPHPRTKVHSYYLEGRIGSKQFPIGARTSFVVEEDGVLDMRQNETGSRDDNEGSVSVTVRISG